MNEELDWDMTYPPISIPWIITPEFVRTSPYIFLYGTSVHKPQPSGQAEVGMMFPEKCFGLPTMNTTCPNSRFFQDNCFRDIKIEIDVAISRVPLSHEIHYKVESFELGNIIIPFPKIGEGYSRMFELAPKCYKYLIEEINKIKYPNIKYV